MKPASLIYIPLLILYACACYFMAGLPKSVIALILFSPAFISLAGWKSAGQGSFFDRFVSSFNVGCVMLFGLALSPVLRAALLYFRLMDLVKNK